MNFTLLPFQEVTSAKATEAIRLSMRKVCPPSVLGSVLDSFVAEQDGTVK